LKGFLIIDSNRLQMHVQATRLLRVSEKLPHIPGAPSVKPAGTRH